MKIKIKPYLLRLIKKNSPYLISIVFIFFLIFAIVKISYDKISKVDANIKILDSDVKNLQKKAQLFQNVLPPTEKLDEDIKLLNRLIPNIEDFFSIIYSLEKLSSKTGFVIDGYAVDMTNSTSEKLRLSITGTGDTATFMKFLDEYNFGGGRLITSDRIELKPELSGTLKVDLTFYNKNVPISGGEELPTSNKIFEDIEAIKKKVVFDFEEQDLEKLDLEYPKKNNPFSEEPVVVSPTAVASSSSNPQ